MKFLIIFFAMYLVWCFALWTMAMYRCLPWRAHVKCVKLPRLQIDVGCDFRGPFKYKHQTLVHWTGLTHIYTDWYTIRGRGINIWYCRKDK